MLRCRSAARIASEHLSCWAAPRRADGKFVDRTHAVRRAKLLTRHGCRDWNPDLMNSSLLIERLRAIVGPDALLTSPSELFVYECDAYTVEKNRPDVVVFPTSTEQIVR